MNKNLSAAAENVFRQCFKRKKNESVLIVTDSKKLNLAKKFLCAAEHFSQLNELVCFDTMTGNAQEPPQEISQKMAQADIVLLITTFSLSHTQARKKACQAGARIASMPGITADIAHRTLTADYSKIARLSKKLSQLLTQAKTARLTNPAGTELVFDLKGRKAMADTGLYLSPGDWGNLPAGEACIGPLENQTQGRLVIDGSIGEIKLNQPLEIMIKNGFAVSLKGGKAAKILKNQLKQAGPKANQVAELGIGTNPLARVSNEVLEAEKVYGTCHVALGNNLSYGGTINVPIHEDGVILKPTLWLENKMILKDGEFLL